MKIEKKYTCPSCNQNFTGKFCSNCGEKKISPHDFSIKHFVEESIEGFTHFDNKFFRTIKVLFSKPGSLTTYFEQGIKVPFMKPVQFFVVCNLIFFLLVGSLNVFTVPLENYLTYSNYKAYGTLDTFVQKFGADADIKQISLLFNEKITAQSKVFIFLFIPFVALACFFLLFKKKKYFSLHLVFATHFFCFLLLFFILFRLLFELPYQYFFRFSPDKFDNIATIIVLLVMFIYLTVSIRRYYRINWALTILSGLIIGFIFTQLFQLYRIGLYYKIIHSI
jgi:hypothetical protein